MPAGAIKTPRWLSHIDGFLGLSRKTAAVQTIVAAVQRPKARLNLGELLILATTKFVETCFVSCFICTTMNLA
jgi:hypothetical protein